VFDIERRRMNRSVLNSVGGNVRVIRRPAKKRIEDRRVRRTRTLLQDALMSLMVEKGYEAATVQDIIDRANVGRATFYAHFSDKRSLLVSRLEDLRASLLRRQREALLHPDREAGQFSFIAAMLEHAAGGLTLWRALAGSEGGAFVLRRIHEMVVDLVRNDLTALGMTRPSAQREMLAQYVGGAFMGTMTWWLDDGTKLSAREVDEFLHRVLASGLGADIRSRTRAVS
jgi:AcrR family transcriptional regulator